MWRWRLGLSERLAPSAAGRTPSWLPPPHPVVVESVEEEVAQVERQKVVEEEVAEAELAAEVERRHEEVEVAAKRHSRQGWAVEAMALY